MTWHPQPDYFAGLDLGQAQEFTALAVLEKTYAEPPMRYWEVPGTSFAAVAARLAEMFSSTDLAGETLVVDQTALGQPVVDMLRRADIDANLVSVTITPGHNR